MGLIDFLLHALPAAATIVFAVALLSGETLRIGGVNLGLVILAFDAALFAVCELANPAGPLGEPFVFLTFSLLYLPASGAVRVLVEKAQSNTKGT